MAVISEMEEPEEQSQTSSSSPLPQTPPPSSPSSTVGPYDEALSPILDPQNPLLFLEIAIDFLRRKSDLFEDEAAERKINALVSAAKAKAAEESKKKKKKKEAEERAAEDARKAEKRVKETDSEAPKKAAAPAKASEVEKSGAAEAASGKGNVRSEFFFLFFFSCPSFRFLSIVSLFVLLDVIGGIWKFLAFGFDDVCCLFSFES